MKKAILTVFSLCIISTLAFAQSGDDILGKWKSGHGNGQIQIFKRGDNYFGKLIWLKEPNDPSGKPKLDIHNPSKELQTQPVLGLEVLKDFTYKGNGSYSNGKIYDPKSGNTYNCMMSIHDRDKLNIRAYFGLSILGKTETWNRVQ
ncbi:DUF2147 domain-containing protein [Pedobacter sp. P351]|uniref:DUF2147 domain-containing protein n=1 Tax=Pedobacter superstes TaxID=3133441 RepID=UPI0030B7171C